MKNKFLIFALITATLTGGGCSPDEIVSESQVKTTTEDALFTVDPQYGFLKFRDQAAFDQTLDYLYRHQASLDSFEASISGFVSQRAAYNSIDTDEERMEIVNNPQGHPYRNFLVLQEGYDGQMEAVRVVDPVVSAVVVNQNGLVAIGSYLYKFTKDQILSTDKVNDVIVLKMTNWLGGIALPGMQTTDIIHQLSTTSGKTEANLLNQCSQSYSIGNKEFRVKGTADYTVETFQENGNQITRRVFSARTEHSARKFGAWWDDKGSLTLTAVGSLTWGTTVEVFDIDQDALDDSRIEEELARCTDCSGWVITFSTNHIAGQSGQSATCQLNR